MGIAVEKIKSNVDASVIRIELNDMGDYAAMKQLLYLRRHALQKCCDTLRRRHKIRYLLIDADAAISADDDALFDRFVSSHDHIAERAEQFDAEIAELDPDGILPSAYGQCLRKPSDHCCVSSTGMVLFFFRCLCVLL